MEYLISAVMAIICGIASYIAIRKPIADKVKIFNILGSGDKHESKEMKKIEIALIVAVIAILSFAATVRLLFQIDDIMNITKILLLYVPIVCSGCVDYRAKRIPNIFTLTIFIEGLVFLAIEYFTRRESFESYAVSCGLSFAACLVLLSLVGSVTGQGIGAGDIKLLSTLGLVGGVYMICGTVIVATFVCAIVAVALLIAKKRSLKSSLPYGPFILVGFFTSIIIKIY